MRRDMELIRTLLQKIEDDATTKEQAAQASEEVKYHLALLVDAGFIEGLVETDPSGGITAVMVNRMTWAGHEFLDSTADPKVWAKIRDRVLKPGVSFSVAALGEVVKAEIQRQLGGLFGLTPNP